MSKESGQKRDLADEPGASLVDRKATGGIIALAGFEFQRRYARILLLLSLPDPDWSAILVEGAEDVEIRFEKQGNGERRAFQIKNHDVTTSRAKTIIDHFVELDKTSDGKSPGTWTSFTIVCTGLDATMSTIHNQLEKYNRTKKEKFYSDTDGILSNTRDQLMARISEAKLPVEFVVESVNFEPNLSMYNDDDWVRSRASYLLQKMYPQINYNGAEAIYLRLYELVSESIGKPITRHQIESTIQAELEQPSKDAVESGHDVDELLKLFGAATFMEVDLTGGDPTAVFAGIRRTRFAMSDKMRFLLGGDSVAARFRSIQQQLYELENETWEKYPEVANLADNGELDLLKKNERTKKVRTELGDEQSDKASEFLRWRAVQIRNSVEKLVVDLKELTKSS